MTLFARAAVSNDRYFDAIHWLPAVSKVYSNDRTFSGRKRAMPGTTKKCCPDENQLDSTLREEKINFLKLCRGSFLRYLYFKISVFQNGKRN